MTALLAAMVSDSVDSLQVALAHLFFNITGIIIWYPLPFMRNIPLSGARALGRMTRIWRGFPLVYIALVFFLIPLFFLGLSALFTQHTKGWTVLGVLITLMAAMGIAYTSYWCYFKEGKKKMIDGLKVRQRKQEAIKALPDDMDALKRKIQILMDHTGAPDDDEEEEDVEKQALVDGKEADVGDDSEIENEIQT